MWSTPEIASIDATAVAGTEPEKMPDLGGAMGRVAAEGRWLPMDDEAENISLDVSGTALVLVDVQPEYWSDAPAIRKDFAHFPERLGRLLSRCRASGMPIIFVRAGYTTETSPWLGQVARLRVNKAPGQAPERLEILYDPETSTWEPFAAPQPEEPVFVKPSWNSCSNPALVQYLQERGIHTVLMCGLITSVCVQHSAFGMFEAGFRTIVVEDACADRSKERHDAALFLYGGYMYEVFRSDRLFCDACEGGEASLLQAEC